MRWLEVYSRKPSNASASWNTSTRSYMPAGSFRWSLTTRFTNTIASRSKTAASTRSSPRAKRGSAITPRSSSISTNTLIPGLVNAHTHEAMSLFRGLADDLPLMDWLNNHIWPAEGTWVNPEFARDGTELAMAEMLRGGVTCFYDMYFFPDETARAAAEAGMRAAEGMILIDFPTAWAAIADEYLGKGLALHDHYKNHPLITTAFAPHAPYTVSNGPLERVRTLADQLNVQIHMHVHETAFEVHQAEQSVGERPLARLEQLGLLTPQLLAEHMTQLDDGEIAACARTCTFIVFFFV